MMMMMNKGLSAAAVPRASPRASGALSPSSNNNNNNHNPLHHTGTPGSVQPQGRMELEVAWNPAVVCAELHKASQILSDRGLKLAAKWAVEQWMGLPAEVLEHHQSRDPASNNNNDDLVLSRTLEQQDSLWKENSPAVHYAKALFDLGDYAHAAATLSQPSLSKAPVESMPPPLPNLSPYGVYLRSYALYMAGERRKEEDHLEQKRYLMCDSARWSAILEDGPVVVC